MEQTDQNNKCIARMLGVMDTYYNAMKTDLGIAEQQRLLKAEQEGSNDDALRLDEVLNKLRPNTTAKNFKELLTRGDNFNKTTGWRRVSRKLHPTVPAQKEKPATMHTSKSISSRAVEGSKNFKTSVLNAYDPSK